MDLSPSSPVSPAPSPTGEPTVPLLFFGMDRVCPCPDHNAQPQPNPDMHESGTVGDIILEDSGGTSLFPAAERYYTTQLGFDWTDIDDSTSTYYGDDWLSEGASDVEELDTASVEVSVDEDDLVAREAEAVAGQR